MILLPGPGTILCGIALLAQWLSLSLFFCRGLVEAWLTPSRARVTASVYKEDIFFIALSLRLNEKELDSHLLLLGNTADKCLYTDFSLETPTL